MTVHYDNLFLNNSGNSLAFKSKNRTVPSASLPSRERREQGARIIQKLNAIQESVTSEEIVQLPIENGMYLEFQSPPGFPLALKSLENKVKGIELMNVKKIDIDDDDVVEYATVFIPRGAENYFVNKAEQYLERNTNSGKPCNQNLIDHIEEINLALVASFFPNRDESFVSEECKNWYEVWLSKPEETNESVEATFRNLLSMLEVDVKSESIIFPDKLILMILANKRDLANLIYYSPSISEFRKATVANTFFLDFNTSEQRDWIDDANQRIINESSNTVINIIDTGIRRTHPLLEEFLQSSDAISYDSDWNPFDRIHGHGTGMAGIALYDGISEILESSHSYSITHSLESSKIIPDSGENEPALYGAITLDVISQQEISNPDRLRVNCMAVTSPDIDTFDGKPSSWSAAIDEITSGAIDEKNKLMLISAGNVRNLQEWMNYPNINQLSSVENPGQSWNALTIGAFTQRDQADLISLPGMRPIAPHSGLSPSSKTSITWDKKWPIKPEVLFEGGNGIRNEHISDVDENYAALTTYHQTDIRLFHFISDTSEATAHASWMAAKIWNKYPEIWPETVRALIVHSAEWTVQMKEQFLSGTRKIDYRNLLRTCGYGVPSLTRAINSMNNKVNMVIESEIQPYTIERQTNKMNEMHLHDLPWPKEELLRLGETEVQLKVTLSYFIEPSPGEKGWKNQYRYPSSLLRFDLNGSRTRTEFLKSINSLTETVDEEESAATGIAWTLGTQRNVGSIHSDYWKGTAADLAISNWIGVYPAIGWWKERKKFGKGNNKLRYSLIVSLSTEADVDLYTPIFNQISGHLEV